MYIELVPSVNGIAVSELDEIAVEADKRRMTEALGHLLSNAVKFSPRGGVVQVSVELVEQELDGALQKYAKINVRDEGRGIAQVMI